MLRSVSDTDSQEDSDSVVRATLKRADDYLDAVRVCKFVYL